MADIEQVTYRQRLDKFSLPQLAALSEKLWGEVDTLARRTVEKSWDPACYSRQKTRWITGLGSLAEGHLPRYSKAADETP